MREPALPDLDAFAAVARHRSFRAAARIRDVSPSSLSDAVRGLEERLGVRLLNRTTRSVTLTDAGQRLYDRLLPALSEVAEALDSVNGFRDTPMGTVRLNVPGVAARTVLARLAGPFLAAHPGIRLEVIVEDAFVDVFAAGYDAGVRYEERLDQDMIAVPLGPPQRYALAASPALIAREGMPRVPEDLLGRPCIRHRFLSGAPLPWEFEKDGRTVRVDTDGPLVVNSADLAIRAAEDGVGWVMSFEEFLRPSLEAGRLVEALADWNPPFPGPYLYYPSRRHMPAALRALVDFIKARER
jgi:DNA-binding transcriptional LysR family regulator